MRRSLQNTRGQQEFFSHTAYFALMANLEAAERQTLTDAPSHSEKAKWKLAWESELSSLARNNMWVIETLPKERRAIGCHWIFLRKSKGRYEACLVAKAYSQEYRIDYSETFTPVGKFTTIRLLLALSCESNWGVIGMDVMTAFLNSELEEVVYMEIPDGVTVPTNKNTRDYHQPLACRLLKSIYGLKQSPWAWYGSIHSFFRSHNFERSPSDHSLFIISEYQIILFLYVDDLVIAAPTYQQID